MSSSNTLSASRPFVLPSVTGLLGLMGVATGINTLRAPSAAITTFGLTPPSKLAISPHIQAFQTSLIRAYGVRNIGGGLSSLVFSAWWFLETDPARRKVITDVLRVSMVLGPIVGLGDAWLVGDYADQAGEQNEESVKQTAKAHAVVGCLMVGVAGFSYFLG